MLKATPKSTFHIKKFAKFDGGICVSRRLLSFRKVLLWFCKKYFYVNFERKEVAGDINT